MIKGLSSKKDIIQIEKEEFIQDIVPVTYNVGYKSLEHREAFDFNDVKLHPISDTYLFRLNNKEIVICVSVDGSEHSQYCVDLLNEDFIPLLNCTSSLSKDSEFNQGHSEEQQYQILGKYLAVYVYFSSKDKDFNYSNSKDNIVSKFCEKLGKYKSYNSFYIEDRWTKKHSIHQVMIHAQHNKCDFIFAGYYGFKGPKGENKELSKGINYLLGNSSIPAVIIKEKIHRNETKSKGLIWLIVLERNYFGRIKTLESFLPLIDKEKDTVYGLGLYENIVPTYDTIEKEFKHYCEKVKFKNVIYEAHAYKNYVSEVISDKVNHGETNFNFICFMNNMIKHHTNPNDNDYAELVRKCAGNICFINVSPS